MSSRYRLVLIVSNTMLQIFLREFKFRVTRQSVKMLFFRTKCLITRYMRNFENSVKSGEKRHWQA